MYRLRIKFNIFKEPLVYVCNNVKIVLTGPIKYLCDVLLLLISPFEVFDTL